MKQDYLLTYNPNNFEAHPDSSDFESCVPPLPTIKNKPGYHRLVKASFGSKTKNIYYNKVVEREYSKKEYSVDSPDKECQANSSLTYLKKKGNKHYGQFNRGTPPEQKQSRLCVLRQKVLPRLSTIFGQSGSNKQTVRPRSRKLAYSSCQQCQPCLRKKNKKPFSCRENSIVQPVYALEAGVHLPKVFIPKDSPKNACSFSSTSDSNNPEKIRRKNSKYKKRFRTEMMREHWNYQQTQKDKCQKHQNTPTDRKPVQQVYNNSTRCHQSRIASSISDYSYMAEMPSSGFWDFLFDKIHRKYQIHKCEVQPCACAESVMVNTKPSLQMCCCDPKSPCFTRSTKSNQFPSQQLIQQQNSRMTRYPSSDRIQDYCEADKKISSSSVQKPVVKCKCKPPSTKKPKSQGTGGKSPIGTPKVSPSPLKCPPECGKQFCLPDCALKCPPKCPPTCAARPPVDDDIKPCQEDHDEIKNMLAQKYNGEILCIHNPPCILINGCLNLPAQNLTAVQPNNSFWPVLFKNIPIKKKHKFRNIKREKSCQYGQSCEVQHAGVPEFNKEEKMQSLYPQVPPCELARSCDKKKYDPSLINACDHVPTCKKRPDCIVNRSPWGSLKSYVCDHLPKCPEQPISTETYELLNGTDNFSSQAQRDMSRACRHTPHCIMVPKCMGGVSVLNNFVQYEAIPDCSHSPACENIPACCRKNHKEMVTVSSQYPNSCRIV